MTPKGLSREKKAAEPQRAESFFALNEAMGDVGLNWNVLQERERTRDRSDRTPKFTALRSLRLRGFPLSFSGIE
jgi:hypothetical protein